ncbi:MAG TPA: HAMP domain-containing sensor histidine kinase [Bryobacteraceae bacterium]|jgi:signal transduction histidine kinase/Tfp pilus assembly protein PilE|nr:HAMP domain-containing sensor histidine kinase [Bryobacteraceae bacterium]
MASPAKRAFLPVVVVLVLAAVLVLLAVLQYRWSLEISRAERTRIEAALSTSVNQFRQEFYRELTQVSTAFHSDATADPDDFWSSYADRYQDWARSTARPDLVANVYVWRADAPAGSRLLQLRTADGQFDPVEWPASLADLRTHIEEEARQRPGPGPEGNPAPLRSFAWSLEERIPALVRPIFSFSGPARRRGGAQPPEAGNPPGPPPRVVLGFVIVELNRAALDRMLGELAQRYFAGPDGFIYNVAVVSGAPDRKIIYHSDAQLTAASLSPPDARAALVPVAPAESRAMEGAPPRELPTLRRRGVRRGGGSGGSGRGPFLSRGRGSFILPSAVEAPWELLARHKGGSLEAVVAADRRRNLLLSFGVLLVLAVSMGLIIISAQRARRLARLQMEFVAGVSHELRTPVAVICSAADNLAEGFVGAKDQVKEYGALIRREGRRLAGMIEQILRFAAGQSRPATYDLGPVPVADVIARVLANLAALPEAEGFIVEREIDPDLPPVQADAAALTHCVENLIANAMKYGGEARWARVRAATMEGGSRVRISVEDRGAGIDPADLPHIFEPFYRGKDALTAQIHGAGLGLSLARDIAEGMGGRLEVLSEPGQGSTFTLNLAAAATGPAAEALPRTA